MCRIRKTFGPNEFCIIYIKSQVVIIVESNRIYELIFFMKTMLFFFSHSPTVGLHTYIQECVAGEASIKTHAYALAVRPAVRASTQN